MTNNINHQVLQALSWGRMVKIAIVAADKVYVRRFKYRLHDSFVVLAIEPVSDIASCAEAVLGSGAEAVIVASVLNEYRTKDSEPVSYSGEALIKQILEIKPDFPAFLLADSVPNVHTSYSIYLNNVLLTDKKAQFIKEIHRKIGL